MSKCEIYANNIYRASIVNTYTSSTVDPFARHNTLNFVLGSGAVLVIRTSVHQLQVQRYMSLPSLQDAKRFLVEIPFIIKQFLKHILNLTALSC